MSKPTQVDAWRAKRVVRYLRHHDGLWWVFELKKEPKQIIAKSDADWAGDPVSRRSTSGGILAIGTDTVELACLLTWSRTQGGVSLSSAEAEYMAMAMAASEAIMLQSLAGEIGYMMEVILESDAAATISAVEKRGVLRFKHLAIKWLFLKELCCERRSVCGRSRHRRTRPTCSQSQSRPRR